MLTNVFGSLYSAGAAGHAEGRRCSFSPAPQLRSDLLASLLFMNVHTWTYVHMWSLLTCPVHCLCVSLSALLTMGSSQANLLLSYVKSQWSSVRICPGEQAAPSPRASALRTKWRAECRCLTWYQHRTRSYRLVSSCRLPLPACTLVD